MSSKEILINQLFAGRYLDEGENIGHEVINLFKDDKGDNYLYITPSGRVVNHNVDSILFVRNISAKKTTEVIALAEDLSPISDEEQKEIRYAGATLPQIFKSNINHGDVEISYQNVTYRAARVVKPKDRIFITVDKDYNDPSINTVLLLETDKKALIPQSLRLYFSENETAYKQLKALISDSDIWEDCDSTEKVIAEKTYRNQGPSFLEIIRKENDELVFSNLFAYYFDYSHAAFQRFASNLLDISDMDSDFVIFRESKSRVDLWIESEQHIIVIENKIKSGINGIVGDDISQLEKYYDAAANEAQKTGKKIHFYIFAPDYAKFDIDKFSKGQEYKIIKYSTIYDFFKKEMTTFIGDRAFPDFIRGLEMHTMSISDLQYRIMKSRLLIKISQSQ